MNPPHPLTADHRPRRKLVAMLGMVLLAVLAILGYLIWSGYQEAVRAAGTTTRNYASILETRLEATLRRADAVLQERVRTLPAAALNQQAVPRYAGQINVMLDSLMTNFNELAGLRIFDAAGEQIYSSDRANTPRSNVADRAYFRRLRDDPQAGLVFSEVVTSRTTNRQSMAVARALRDGQGVFRGIVLASLELEYFQKLFRSLDLGAQGVVAIRRSDDFTQVVRWPPLDSETNKPLSPTVDARQAISAGISEATTELTGGVDGVSRILSFRKLERYPFFVLTAMGRDDVLAGWRARSLRTGGAGLLLLGLLAALLVRLWRTEAREAQSMAALAQSEERARLVLDTSMDAVIGMDSEGRVTEWSAAATPMFGYTRGEALGKTLSDLIVPPALRDAHTRGLKRFLATGAGAAIGSRMETTAMRAGGTEFPVELSIAHIAREGGNFFGAFVRDIGERVRADASLRAGERKYRSIYENIQDVYVESSVEGTILEMSPQIEALTKGQYRREDYIGQSAIAFYADAERRADFIRALREHGNVKDFESQFINRDGSPISCSISARLIVDEQGQPQRVVATLRDIGERVQAERALRISEAHLRAISDNASVGILVLLDGRYAFANREAARMLGYDIEELLQIRMTDVIHPDSRALLVERHRRRLAGEDVPSRYEAVALARDGHAIPVELNAAVTRWNGQTADMVFVSDITARKQAEAERRALEAQLRQAQKLEAVGTLSGGIAHDFNNILGAILGNVELARQDLAPAHPALESLDEIAKAGARARDLVQQILAFSRKQVQQRRAITLPPVIEEAVKLMRATLPSGIHLATAYSADAAKVPVLADSTQVHQVVMNLCTNAAHAMQGKPGRIEVALRPIELPDTEGESAGLPAGHYVELSVRDTGCGMDAATLEHIFEPFYTTRDVGEGTGLGLAVVHGIMQAHEGAVRVDSRPGEGSAFHLYFPALENEAQTAEPELEAPASGAGRGQHVLYVDDDESLVYMVTRMLERQGYRVSGHTWAKDALGALRADPHGFDLVVTDYNMPGMSGLDLAREVHAIRADLPVALISGYITDELRRKAAESGVNELIYKPNAVEELCEAVHRLTQTTESD